MKKESTVNSKIVHVMKRGEGWAIRKHGAGRATRVYSRKDAAIKNALKFIPLGLDVVIHRKDGTIQKWEKASINI